MAHPTRRKTVSRRHGQGAARPGLVTGTKKPVKKNGHAQRQRAKQAHGAGAIEKHQGGSRGAKAGPSARSSLPIARPEITGEARFSIRESAEGLVRPRLLLASTFGRELRVGQIAEVTSGVLATKVGEQSAPRSTKSRSASQAWMARDGRLGMSDQEHQAPYDADASLSGQLKSIELFTGAGGLALGLQQAGFEPKLMVEWDDHAYETIKANSDAGGPARGWPIKHADVRDITFHGYGEVDLVAGGPPCQPFSIGGKHGGHTDTRDMWPQAIRAVRELQPRAFMFENVRGLAREAFSSYLKYIVERLSRPNMAARPSEDWQSHLSRLSQLQAEDGDGPFYKVQVYKINAANYGAAQKRHRVIVIGIRSDVATNWEFPAESHSYEALVWNQFVTRDYWRRHRVPPALRPLPDASARRLAELMDRSFIAPAADPWVTVRDAIGSLPDPRSSEAHKIANHRFQPGARSYAGHTGSPMDEPAKALKAGDHGVPGGENMVVLPDGGVRYFTVRESARLQGFPDNFVFPGSWTETMRQLGNAVPVPMARAIATTLADAIQGSRRASVGPRRAA